MKGNCSICGSDKNVRNYKGKQILCGKHREQMRRFGEIRYRTLADGNDYIDVNTHYEMRIYDRNLSLKAVALIDRRDRETVGEIGSWCVDKGGYVLNGKKKIKLHQLIIGNKKGYEIDHKNGNKLDNRRSNLEHVTHSENVRRGWLRRHLAEGKDAESFFENTLTK